MDRWEYLPHFPFTARHRLAEYFVGDLLEVVDVGTYKHELDVRGRLWSVDPLDTVGGFVGSVSDFVRSFQPRGIYGVVCLGLALEGGQHEADALVELCEGSEILVLEWATEYEHPVIDPSYLVKSKRRLFHASLDFPLLETPGHPCYPLRTFEVWV